MWPPSASQILAVQQLTDLVYVEFPSVGQQLTQGETFGEVESVKAVSDLYAPIAGEVLETNEPLVDDLSILSEDPYSAGWIIRLKASSTDTSHLLDYQAYRAFCDSAAH